MHDILLFLAQAQATPASGPASGGTFGFFLPMIAIFGLMYFLMIRPQQKKQKEQNARITALKTGDAVITAGGVHGRIANVKETSVIVKVADNVKIEFEKSAITTVIKQSETEPTKTA